MEFGIYFHIPFCIQLCSYCDFNKILRNSLKKTDLENYQKAMLLDCDRKLERKPDFSEISTVYFGGGTPSLYPVNYIGDIIDFLKNKRKISPNAEITMEVDPKTIRLRSLKLLHDSGINRLSIGAQSFNDNILETLNRYHRTKDIMICYEDARKAGFKNISLDLIFGVPLSSLQTWKNDMKNIISLQPEHVSLYSLNIAKGTKMFRERKHLNLPSDITYEWCYRYAAKELKKNGLLQYEISNFSIPGLESRHNMDCWNLKPYLGIGAGASSYYGNKRTENFKNFKKYIFNSKNKARLYSRSYPLNLRDRQIEFVMLQLRKKQGFEKEKYKSLFNSNVENDFPLLFEKEIAPLIKTARRIKLTTKGMLLSNEVFERLFY